VVAAAPSRIPKKSYPPLPSKQHNDQHHPKQQQQQQQQQPARSAALSELNAATGATSALLSTCRVTNTPAAAAATATAHGLAVLRSMIARSRELLASIVGSLHR
jgi:predicted component of type VI protein secretion system